MPKKYVDLDEALELFDADMNFRNWNGEVIGKLAHVSAFQKMAREKLLSLPLADVIERKTARWEMKPDPYGFFEEIPVCSECGCTTKWREKYHYCPNCGAEMEQKNER